jgi:hypothetical protein
LKNGKLFFGLFFEQKPGFAKNQMVFPGGCFGVNMCELSVYSHWILTHPQVTVSQVTACWGPGPALAVKRSGCGSSMPAGDGGNKEMGQIQSNPYKFCPNYI